MSAADDLNRLRADQHDDEYLTSDAELDLFCNTVDPRLLALERLAHASETELRAVRHVWRAT